MCAPGDQRISSDSLRKQRWAERAPVSAAVRCFERRARRKFIRNPGWRLLRDLLTPPANVRVDDLLGRMVRESPGTLTWEGTIADDWSPKGPVELKSRVEIM
jgi:hypothetical protein